jgi:hypothetical protein
VSAPTLLRKSFSAVTKVVDERQGLVEAIVNSTGIVDLQNERMEVGCWDALCKSMAAGEADYPSVLWGHNWEIPVGKVLHAEELYPGDARLKSLKATKGTGALRIVSQYNLETQRGREAFSDVKFGSIKRWSVGFMPDDNGHDYDAKGVHIISKVGMWPEVSNVLIGASPGTFTAIAKSAEEVLVNSELSISDKALAIEQVCLQAVEDGNESEALSIALGALKTLSESPPAEKAEEPQQQAETTAAAGPTAEQLADMLTQLVIERLNTPPQQSDPEDDSGELTTNWARHNIRPI